ncbi:MAG: peptide chain release factor 2 [Planctomycetota bacterium]
MDEELKGKLDAVREALVNVRDSLDVASNEAKVAEIEEEMAEPDFWSDSDAAQRRMRQMKRLKSDVEPVLELERLYEEAALLFDLAAEEGDEASMAEVRDDVNKLEAGLDRLRFRLMFSGRHDGKNAFVSIHAGAGGTESCDWAEMLLRMYQRWTERHGFDLRMIDHQPGEAAGIRRATINVIGSYAYGHLKSEIGVHRLVRISPFDAGARRHTSFASVDVVPELEDDIQIEMNEGDLRIDTYRSSGAGGQHVNVTDSAVRITHLPTGVVVQCQNERSQHKNRSTALKVLRARLYRLEEKKREDELRQLYGEKGEIAWGNQIRSYVLQPYQMVKDHRTDHQTGNTDAVLDGEIDGFIEAYLKRKMQA